MKRYAPYILILIILVGLFSPMVKINAQAATPPPDGSVLQNNLKACSNFVTGDFDGCVEKLFYYIFYAVPAFLLSMAAQMFNALISLTLNSTLFKNNFVSAAWAVVRDLSNIFFILILLYIAIQTILGLGHETKKMIVKVVIMALLINFSMFFTKVVIDTSNILALIFYNKITVTTTTYVPFTNSAQTGTEEKDISGTLVDAFDPSKMLSQEFFDKYKTETQAVGSKLGFATYVAGGAAIGAAGLGVGAVVGAAGGAAVYGAKTTYAYFFPQKEVPTPMILAIILISGLIMSFAAYAFFIAGFSFLSRLIELWILIIFSPFAFMSSTIPLLSQIESIGWDGWLKRVLKVSFMAPIFMFFLYLIFLFLKPPGIFTHVYSNQGALEAIFTILLPALVILILLHKATKWAKDASGELGEVMMKGAKIVGGVALGAATGGTALAARAAIGGAGGAAVKTLAEKAEKGMASSKFGVVRKFSGFTGEKLRDASDLMKNSSFDARGVKVFGQNLGSATGLHVGDAGKGSWSEMKKQQIEKRKKRADELEKRGTSGHKDAVEEAEVKLKEATLPVKLKLDDAEKVLQKAKETMADAATPFEKEMAAVAIKAAKDAKEQIRKDAKLKGFEDAVRASKQALEERSGKIRHDYATSISDSKDIIHKISNFASRLSSLGAYSPTVANEAARKIRMGENYSGGGSENKPHTPPPSSKADHYKPSDSKPASSGGGHSTPASGGGGGHAAAPHH